VFVGQMRFDGNVYAQFDSGFRAPFRAHIELVGSRGRIEVPRPFKPGLDESIALHQGDAVQTIRVAGQELYLGEVEDLADAVLNGAAPRVSLKDSRGNVAAIEALLESARQGRPVTLS
jgi:predicted dehydrogenase